MTAPDLALNGLLDRTLRADRGRIIAALIARVGDFQLAEDALQDASASALVHWGRSGAPSRPEAWLIRVAFRKAIDRLRRMARDSREMQALSVLAQDEAGEVADIMDDRLRLIFTCCHPALEPKTRVALTLRTLGGLTTTEIARAFLDDPATMGQRLSRAKTKIAAAGIPFAVPGRDKWADRLQSVLVVIYLIFNQGYSANPGPDPLRRDLCEEAIFLARMVDALHPGEPEVEGLLALMLLTHARHAARHDAAGDVVTLEAQDRSLWDAALIAEGAAVLDRAVARHAPGPFQIKAALAALHAAKGPPDWPQIVLLYDSLLRMEPTPVIRLNRAVALAEAGAPGPALCVLERLEGLDTYQPYHAARADLLMRMGRIAEAVVSYDRAIALAGSVADASFLGRRRDAALGARAEEEPDA